MNTTIRLADWNLDGEQLKEIRYKVFIQEQAVDVADEWDEYDETATHFLVSKDSSIAIACARLLSEDNSFHIGRVAVLAEYRHQTIGRQLMQFILNWCKQNNSQNSIYLNAQTSRINFYEYLGFKTQGDVFMDAGIEHIEMWYQVN